MNVFVSPIDKEVSWDKNLELVSKTDQFGTILYCNENFVNISGYEEHELVGRPHSIIRHPDMPKVIFKILWDHISNGEDFHAVVKNMAKSGRFYWVITQFEIIKNDEGNIIGYIGRRRSVSDNVIRHFEKLYVKLLKIESEVSIKSAEDYIYGFLEDHKKTYQEFLSDILAEDAMFKDIDERLAKGSDGNDGVRTRKSFLKALFGG
jgi:PAS domain S-box-containing protein